MQHGPVSTPRCCPWDKLHSADEQCWSRYRSTHRHRAVGEVSAWEAIRSWICCASLRWWEIAADHETLWGDLCPTTCSDEDAVDEMAASSATEVLGYRVGRTRTGKWRSCSSSLISVNIVLFRFDMVCSNRHQSINGINLIQLYLASVVKLFSCFARQRFSRRRIPCAVTVWLELELHCWRLWTGIHWRHFSSKEHFPGVSWIVIRGFVEIY